MDLTTQTTQTADEGMTQTRAVYTIAVAVRVTVIAVGVAFLAWLLGSFALVVFLTVLFSLLLRGLATAVRRVTGLPMWLAMTLVTVLITGSAVFGLYWDGPRFIHEMEQLVATTIPELRALKARYGATTWGHYVIHSFPSGGGGEGALGALDTGFGILATAVVVLLAGTYVAASPSLYVRGVVRLFPFSLRAHVATVMQDVGRALQWWMLGQAINMISVAAISTIGLFVLGVPLPFALGLLAGLLTFIPYFGAWMGSVPAVLMALTISPRVALWTVGVFLVCHLVEGYVLSPIISRRTVELAPGATLLSMSLLGAFYGPFGLVLATPLVAAVMVVVRESYVRRVLGDRGV